ncbi:PREDICTED: uncharacterized protein LOC107072775 isoform X2 [Polistes dominula]|uniref:Uncharacterized protein LOC107072775 isoform X2 n=1 Tax=Polistes dominula TaxID=743375 RepID=A0ABM1J7L9_POLDO|nr:PREDICTED: uncharacterized protein LOC107072775 isoform X2 [Polistes dominula]
MTCINTNVHFYYIYLLLVDFVTSSLNNRLHITFMFGSTSQKIKAPQHLLRLRDDESYEHELRETPLPDLQRKEFSKRITSPTSWDRVSISTSMSWPEEMENVATEKLLQQWDAIERVLYNEIDNLSNNEILEECMQWKMQIPHLRVIGKGLFDENISKSADYSTNNREVQKPFDDSDTLKLSIECDQAAKDINESSKNQQYKKLKEEIFNIISEYINFQLFPNKNDNTDTLDSKLDKVLKITPASMCRTRTFTKSSKSTKSSDQILYHEDFEDDSSDFNNVKQHEQSSLDKSKPETITRNKRFPQRRTKHSISASKIKGLQKVESDVNNERERLYTPQQNRNKLGTVFNEKIVVSPVPFAVSTRESFSTLKTIPIRFMEQALEISTSQGSTRNSFSNVKPLWKSNSIRIPNNHSVWQTPVSSAVWPKNLRLAPIDTSRLPSSKNRSLLLAASPAVLQRSIKPLSPISHSIMPSTTKIIRDKNNDILEIQGKHITTGQAPKSALFTSNWDCSPRNILSRKKKVSLKNEK